VSEPPHTTLFCHRCGAQLAPGRGDFYLVRVEAIADPTGPSFYEEDELCDPGEEIDRLIEQMAEMSERELMEQVCRRLTLHLCGPCYREWIENPAGG
jgi:hypothetical protein